jgi:folate-binding protein YgfZ
VVLVSDAARQLDATVRACARAELTGWGRLIGTGPDLLDLLQRLGTGDVKGLSAWEGRPTVLTTAKGRIVERLTVHHLGGDGVLLLCGPGGASKVAAHLAKFTFAEVTGLADVTGTTFAHALLGPLWAEAGRAAGLPELPPYGAGLAEVAGARVHVVRTNGFDPEGLVVVGRRSLADAVGAALDAAVAAQGGVQAGAEAFEAWRILRGAPLAGHELTEDHNPLEAGLLDAVSFTKGCYVGQEVVARLRTYDKVSRRLARLKLDPGAPAPRGGTKILAAGREVGAVTSGIVPPGAEAAVALGYVKFRELPAGTTRVVLDDGTGPGEATILNP